MVKRILFAGFCVLVLSAWAVAGPNAGAKVAVHVLPHESRTCGENMPVIESSSDLILTYAGCGDIDVFPVFFGLAEHQCFEYSLTWPDDWGTCAYTSCKDLYIHQFHFYGDPDKFDPGDLVSDCYYDCSWDDFDIPGFGWLAAATPGMICVGGAPPFVTPPGYEGPAVRDCVHPYGLVDETTVSYCAGVGGVIGDDPLSMPAATERSRWGEIKALFR